MPPGFFSRFKKSSPFLPVTVVSGLPRSGTSMMMQILQAGGLQVFTDQMRAADEDNPKGYFEFERAKKLKDGDTQWVIDAQGKVVKIISALLEYLPPSYPYKIIFMLRDMDEILASQKQMLIRRGEPTDKVADQVMADLFKQHLANVQAWLAKQSNMETIYVQYEGLLQNPKPAIEEIIRFLDLKLNAEAMLEAPDRNLHRQKH